MIFKHNLKWRRYFRKRARIWKEANLERYKEIQLKYRRKLKLEVLTHYGKAGTLRCCWHACNVVDIDMLTLDHINNDGYKDRSQTRRGGSLSGLYRSLRKRGFPIGFQTLCMNHQLKKEILHRRK